MPAERISPDKFSNFLPIGDCSGLFLVGHEWNADGSKGRLAAVRTEAPVFFIAADSEHELMVEAFKTISDFLAKMHRFGFRN